MKLAILIGGKGRRIGIEKTEVRICGKRLIEIAIEKFADYEPIFVCRDESQAKRYGEEFGFKFVCDFYRDFGAIAGIHSALKHNGSTVVIAIDMPFAKKRVLKFLFDKGLEMDCDALIPKHEFVEPLLAFYSERALLEIENSIKKGNKKIMIPLSRLKTIYLPVDELRKFDKHLISFFNINTEDDAKKAEELCSEIFMEEL
ncbi:MAG: molybdenum cofactor guanylyltransferase [Archaeoglobaceae archaeon]|nr:molybdenum cofactor guanylyltransferase [Archaeoglobaceae archaeon]MDW7989483.1 molybdenum cofactor guanylyltransferase [Archaeoglobaceae archaeon]